MEKSQSLPRERGSRAEQRALPLSLQPAVEPQQSAARSCKLGLTSN